LALTFENLITHNKRASCARIAGQVVLITLLTAVFTASYQTYVYGAPAEDGLYWGLALGAALAIAGALISYYAGSLILLTVSDGYRVEKADDPRLFNVVEEMAIAAGIPPPAIYAIPDESPNAMATGRDPRHAAVAITTGLRKKLNRDELQAVMAHEIGHIANYDTRLAMLVAVFAGIVVLLSDFLVRTSLDRLGIGGLRGRPGKRSGFFVSLLSVLVLAVVAAVLAWAAPIIAKLLQLAVSRQREYLADATAVKFCRNPEALAAALRKIAVDPAPLRMENRATEHLFIVNPDLSKRLDHPNRDSIWMTHPPVIKRIERIRGLIGRPAGA